MLKKLNKSNSEGFTIIEVMIVLAIAGLILLVVLLAVPALQRNARNTTIKNDASAIAGGVTTFSSNNNGDLPDGTNSSQSGSTLTLKNATATDTATTVKVQGSDAVTFHDGSTTITGVAGAIDVDYGVSCSAATISNQGTSSPTLKTNTVSKRATAIIYSNEISGGLQINCLDS